MTLPRLLFLATTALVLCPALRAQNATPPVMFDQAYSADQLITTREGTTVNSKLFCDHGKVRTELTSQGMNIVAIILPDQQKAYTIMESQKMVMVMPYDPAKYKKYMIGTPNFNGKFEAAGSETVDGVPCNKYKVTTDDKVYDMWIDATKKQPVKMAAEDGAFVVSWKNYVAGPQDPALFQVPAGYQMMDMPSMPGMPGGAGGGGAVPGQ
jgi:hypothetical protein